MFCPIGLDAPPAVGRRTTPVAAAMLLLALAGCGGEPFRYTQASGKVTYDDGSLIPAHRLEVTFLPQAEQAGAAQPRPAVAEVDVKSGAFNEVTSHKFGDGMLPGRHKVLVKALDNRGSPTDLVPAEYRDPKKTPLEVDTKNSPFDLKVARPGRK